MVGEPWLGGEVHGQLRQGHVDGLGRVARVHGQLSLGEAGGAADAQGVVELGRIPGREDEEGAALLAGLEDPCGGGDAHLGVLQRRVPGRRLEVHAGDVRPHGIRDHRLDPERAIHVVERPRPVSLAGRQAPGIGDARRLDLLRKARAGERDPGRVVEDEDPALEDLQVRRVLEEGPEVVPPCPEWRAPRERRSSSARWRRRRPAATAPPSGCRPRGCWCPPRPARTRGRARTRTRRARNTPRVEIPNGFPGVNEMLPELSHVLGSRDHHRSPGRDARRADLLVVGVPEVRLRRDGQVASVERVLEGAEEDGAVVGQVHEADRDDDGALGAPERDVPDAVGVRLREGVDRSDHLRLEVQLGDHAQRRRRRDASETATE